MLGLLAALLCMLGMNLSGTPVIEAYSLATLLLTGYYGITCGLGLLVAFTVLALILFGGTALGALTKHPIVGFVMGSAVSGIGLIGMLGGIVRSALLIGGAWYMHTAVVPGATKLADLDMTQFGLGLGAIIVALLLKSKGKSKSSDD